MAHRASLTNEFSEDLLAVEVMYETQVLSSVAGSQLRHTSHGSRWSDKKNLKKIKCFLSTTNAMVGTYVNISHHLHGLLRRRRSASPCDLVCDPEETPWQRKQPVPCLIYDFVRIYGTDSYEFTSAICYIDGHPSNMSDRFDMIVRCCHFLLYPLQMILYLVWTTDDIHTADQLAVTMCFTSIYS